jgi:hypothetical protein
MTHHVTMPAKPNSGGTSATEVQSFLKAPGPARRGGPPVLSPSLVPCSAELPGEQPIIDPQRSVSAFSPKVE